MGMIGRRVGEDSAEGGFRQREPVKGTHRIHDFAEDLVDLFRIFRVNHRRQRRDQLGALVEDPAGSQRVVPDLGVAHVAVTRQTDRPAVSAQGPIDAVTEQPVEGRQILTQDLDQDQSAASLRRDLGVDRLILLFFSQDGDELVRAIERAGDALVAKLA